MKFHRMRLVLISDIEKCNTFLGLESILLEYAIIAEEEHQKSHKRKPITYYHSSKGVKYMKELMEAKDG